MASVLSSVPELRSKLLGSLTSANGGYCDLRSESVETLRRFRQAAVDAKVAFMSEGPNALVVPDAFEGLVRCASELIAMADAAISERLAEGRQ
jgi:hypothetical protein